VKPVRRPGTHFREAARMFFFVFFVSLCF